MIPTDEDLMIARHAWTLLSPEACASQLARS
jgi:acetate kinase